MAEELQESEVFFSEKHTGNETDHRWYDHHPHHSDSGESQSNTLKRKNKSTSRNSVPVNIPENFSRSSLIQYVDQPDCFEEFDYGDGEIVPPHVIVGRRVAGKMAFSVCSGNGRTLKGRDLRRVRNSILRMTGYLEA